MSAETVNVEIAGYTIGLRMRDAALAASVRSAYALFLSETPYALCVDVELSGDAPGEDSPTARLIFADNAITIHADCLLGALDLVKKTGWLKINPYRSDPVNMLYPLGIFLRNIITLLVTSGGDGIVLHAAGMVRGSDAFVFIGPSTAGKSTVSRLSQDRASVLSDDMVVIRKAGRGFRMYPTPCWGDKQMGPRGPQPYIVRAVFRLIKDKELFLEKFSPAVALADIFTTPHVPVENIPQEGLLRTFSELVASIPYYGLHFLPDPSFWDCIEKEGMVYDAERKDTCQV